MKSFSPQQWYDLSKDVHELIVDEINQVSPDTLPAVYPKLVVMYEFFRCIRGEAFQATRPAGMGSWQKEIYALEGDLADRLKQLEQTLDTGDSRTRYHLDLMKQSFSLKYFNQQ